MPHIRSHTAACYGFYRCTLGLVRFDAVLDMVRKVGPYLHIIVPLLPIFGYASAWGLALVSRNGTSACKMYDFIPLRVSISEGAPYLPIFRRERVTRWR